MCNRNHARLFITNTNSISARTQFLIQKYPTAYQLIREEFLTLHQCGFTLTDTCWSLLGQLQLAGERYYTWLRLATLKDLCTFTVISNKYRALPTKTTGTHTLCILTTSVQGSAPLLTCASK